jgi:hypothetical protein
MICMVRVAGLACCEDGRIYMAACVHEHVSKVSLCDEHHRICTAPICMECERSGCLECVATLTLREGE